MKRRVFAVFAGLLIAGALPAMALAIPGTLDQHQEAGPDYAGGTKTALMEAQTFTAGITGQMSAVSLLLSINGSETINVSIETLDGSLQPSGTVLATGSNPITGTDRNVTQWVVFTLNTPVSVVAGHQYAIVTSVTNAYVFGSFQSTDTYAGGKWWFVQTTTWTDLGFTTYDLAFRTYVTAPDPTAAPSSTPPPTSTDAASASIVGSGSSWLLPIGLIGLIATLAAMSIRRRRTE